MIKTDFLPTTKKDLEERGWRELDVILITGDAYVDHASYGAAVIGRVLEDGGFRVGIIAQPDWKKSDDFLKLGRPRLFFGVTAGNLDSMLSNYTPNKTLRREDDYSPGGRPGLRPNRATIVYTNKVKELFPDTPVIIGGMEASLRRLAHYDYWSDQVRRSMLLDSKADILVYGMGERQVLEIAGRLKEGEDIKDLDGIRGTVIARSDVSNLKGRVEIPSFEEVRGDKDKFNEAFRAVYPESDPFRGRVVVQRHDTRFIVQMPPAEPLKTEEIDRIYLLNYARAWHPAYDSKGGVPGFETVRFSIISHRGCCGECAFCSLYFHQGRIIQNRSKGSILEEVRRLAGSRDFRGTITDIGGPTANLYEAECALWKGKGACAHKKCLVPQKCQNLRLGYKKTLELWESVMRVPGVRHLFIGSGVRYDLLVDRYSDEYLRRLCGRHVSGYLKVAPEHTVDRVLGLMNKPRFDVYERFVERFRDMNRALDKKQFLVNYFISSHPGCGMKEAKEMSGYLAKRKIRPEQIQDFIPLPMTLSGCVYWTGRHPMTGKTIYVPSGLRERKIQRALMQSTQPKNRKLIRKALSP
ncbi:MAG: YgiQ family radical SAM protein [Candidatus Omnitrophota bacterium]